MNRRKRNHGLYYHSSPPKVFPNHDDNAKNDVKPSALVIKPSNIRIWIHDKDIEKLMVVLLEGHGTRLRSETSNHPTVRKFLDYLPHLMGLIKNIHTAVIDNNLEYLKAKTAPPVPPQILSSKDANGLTPLHKAAGLAHTSIVEYLLALWPSAAQEKDNSGKTPLHYAASIKNNERVFNLLVQAGAEEGTTDKKGKAAAFYKKNKNNEDLDRSLLTTVPEAPRIAEQGFPSGFDWNFLPAKFSNPVLKSSQSEYALNNNNVSSNLKPSNSSFEILSTSSDNILNEIKANPKLQKMAIQNSHLGSSRKKKNDINNNPPALALAPAPLPPTKNIVPDVPDTPDDLDDNDDVETFQSEISTPLQASNPYKKLNGHASNIIKNYPEPKDDHLYDNEHYENQTVNESITQSEENDVENVDYDVKNDFDDKEVDLEHNNEVIERNDEAEVDQENELEVNDKSNIEDDVVELVNDEVESIEVDQQTDTQREHEIGDDIDQGIGEPIAKEDELLDAEDELLEPEEAVLNDETQDNINPNEKRLIEDTEQDDITNTIVENEDDFNNEAVEVDSGHDTNEIYSQSGTANSRLMSADSIRHELDQNDEFYNDVENDETDNLNHLDRDTSSFDTVIHPMTADQSVIVNHTVHSPLIDDDNDVVLEKVVSLIENEDDIVSMTERNSSAVIEDDDRDGDNGSSHLESPSPSLEIQGVVKEEEDIQLESQGGGKLKALKIQDDTIQEIIDSADMEQLAQAVLNGEGKKLIGRETNQTDIQAFIDNVPTYMSKIRKVHLAAREGSLRDLQSALDRRKFSTAKDEVSPKGASPLHVAVIFGHTGIIRYLGSRFQETLSATDEDNRTAMHYAATIKDNGHFYNLLMHLGANPKAIDNLGKTAESYLNHDESDKILSHKDLLKTFGAEDDFADEMLNDQEFKNPVEIPLFRTEEGRYLATSLGDPLIKGLTEVANLRPQDPIAFLANYLQNFSTDNKIKSSNETKTEPVKNPDDNKLTIQKPNSTRTSAIPVKQKSTEIMDDDDDEVQQGNDDRDEHGQSMLHFAAARQHGRNALFQLIEESKTSITYRDEIYRSARDVSLQASQPENSKEFDRYVLSLAARGDYQAFLNMFLDGYDHIIDIVDSDGTSVIKVAKSRGYTELGLLMDNLRVMEENREKLLHAIRSGDLEAVKEFLSTPEASNLARAKNYYGRCSLHVAVLMENEEIVDYLAENFRQTLKVGDNLERTALHYSMGINNVEAISRILIKNGAKRVVKDLKGRTASFYYINKSDILRLQEEERE